MIFLLRASDGVGTTVLKSYLNQMSLFARCPSLTDSGSYQLHCHVSQDVLNAFVARLYDDSARVEVTEDNFEQLKNLCEELGFSKLDGDLKAFNAGQSAVPAVSLEEQVSDVSRQNRAVLRLMWARQECLRADLEQLTSQIAKQVQVLEVVQRQLDELVNGKLLERVRALEENSKETTRELKEYVERRVDEIGRVCEERHSKLAQKTEQTLRECAKRRELEELARDVAHLRKNEKGNTTVARRKWQGPQVAPVIQREFVYDETKKLDGIIAYLTRACGGNVHDKGIVNVTAGGFSNDRSDSHPKRVVDFESDVCYVLSDNLNDSWICYDFKERRVIPTSYSVHSYMHFLRKSISSGLCSPACGFPPMSWVVEVSQDGTENSWTEIDRQNIEHYQSELTLNFKIAPVPGESFRFFRLRQTERPLKRPMSVFALEIFGTLFEK